MNHFALTDNDLDVLFTQPPANNYNVNIDLKPIHHQTAKSTKRSSAKRQASTSLTVSSESAPLPNGVIPARCGYRTGKCQNLQAVKRNGKLHKLCEFHREKANMNQKKLDRKKRLQRHHTPYDLLSNEDDSFSFDGASPRAIDESLEDFAPAPTNLHEAPLVLGREELAIFCSLMTFDIHPRSTIAHRVIPSEPIYQPYMSVV